MTRFNSEPREGTVERCQTTADEDRLERRLSLREARALHEPAAPFRTRENLYFLHVPKSGGTSFDSYLTTFFRESEQSPAEMQIERPDLWGEQSHEGYRYRHGAFWLCDVLPLNPDAHFVTLLRDPIKRVISHYWHLRTMPDISDGASNWSAHREMVRAHAQSHSLEEWAATKPGEKSAYVRNLFVRMIGGERSGPSTPDAMDRWLERAKQNLERQFTFCGLLEEYARSKEAFCRTFGLPLHYARGVEKENVTKAKARREPPTERALELLRAENRHDVELYEFACELFEQRWEKLHSGLPDELFDGRDAAAVVSLPVGRLQIDAEAIRGSGFHTAEELPGGQCIRWTGQLPSASQEIAADLPSQGELVVEIGLPMALSREAIEELQLTVNGREPRQVELSAVGGREQLRATYSLDEDFAARGVHTLELTGPVAQPAPAADGAQDPRKLGVAIESVAITWRSAAASPLTPAAVAPAA